MRLKRPLRKQDWLVSVSRIVDSGQFWLVVFKSTGDLSQGLKTSGPTSTQKIFRKKLKVVQTRKKVKRNKSSVVKN